MKFYPSITTIYLLRYKYIHLKSNFVLSNIYVVHWNEIETDLKTVYHLDFTLNINGTMSLMKKTKTNIFLYSYPNLLFKYVSNRIIAWFSSNCSTKIFTKKTSEVLENIRCKTRLKYNVNDEWYNFSERKRGYFTSRNILSFFATV